MAYYRNNNNKTKLVTFCSILSSLPKLLLTALIVIAFGGNPFSICVAASASPPPTCLTGWSYLSYSLICIKLHAGGSALYVDTARLCSTAAEDDQTGVSPLLLGFQSVAAGDFHTLDTVVGDGIHQLWFHVAEALSQQPQLALLQEAPTTTTSASLNYSSCLAIRNRTTGMFCLRFFVFIFDPLIIIFYVQI